MDPVRVELDVSSDLIDLLDVPEEALGSVLKKLVALELCRDGHMSPRRAAGLLKIPRDELVEVLDRRGVDYSPVVPKEAAAQIEEVWEKLKTQSP